MTIAIPDEVLAQTKLHMKNIKENPEPIPPLKPGRLNSYSPADIKRWGVQRFLNEVCEKEPIPIPDLGFTEEENRRMDDVLKEEREAITRWTDSVVVRGI